MSITNACIACANKIAPDTGQRELGQKLRRLLKAQSRRKAYYLMSTHDHLPRIPAPEIEDLGWSKALELAKVVRTEGGQIDCAAWLHTAKQSKKQELKEAVHEDFTGEDYEPYEMNCRWWKGALDVASRMVGTEKSRGDCLELVCADFLAGRGDESSPEEILKVIHRFVHLPPRNHQANIAGESGGRELEAAGRC